LLNNSEVSSYLLGHILLFWKFTMPTFQKTSHFQEILDLKKKISGGSLCTGGAAGIWAVVFLSTTYFGEINIFGLSKDQTLRIWSTFMNPEQFLLLVTYLFLAYFQFLKRSYRSLIVHSSVTAANLQGVYRLEDLWLMIPGFEPRKLFFFRSGLIEVKISYIFI
jgi:hypothetical protein